MVGWVGPHAPAGALSWSACGAYLSSWVLVASGTWLVLFGHMQQPTSEPTWVYEAVLGQTCPLWRKLHSGPPYQVGAAGVLRAQLCGLWLWWVFGGSSGDAHACGCLHRGDAHVRMCFAHVQCVLCVDQGQALRVCVCVSRAGAGVCQHVVCRRFRLMQAGKQSKVTPGKPRSVWRRLLWRLQVQGAAPCCVCACLQRGLVAAHAVHAASTCAPRPKCTNCFE